MAQRQFRTDDTSLWADRYGDGSDGAYDPTTSAWSSAYTTCTGTGGTTSLTVASGSSFFSGALVLIHQSKGTGAGAWELNKIASGPTGTSWTMAYDLMNTYASGAQVVLIKEHTIVTIDGGVTLSTPSYNGGTGGIIAIFAQQSITVTGTISANAAGYDGGDGGDKTPPNRAGIQGQSSTGDGARSTSANGSGGGGGGVGTPSSSDAGGGGGGGGHAASGSTGTNSNGSPQGPGGTGGGTSGSASLVTMTFGGAGGGGGIDDSTTGGVGGNSGGFILLVAPVITVTGAVTANGGNGTSHGDSGGGGGGGSGGSLLFKGQQIALGSSIVTCTAGNGAPGNSAFGGVGGNGGNGAVGRIHVDYSQSLSGLTTPTLDSSIDAVLNDLPSLDNYSFLM